LIENQNRMSKTVKIKLEIWSQWIGDRCEMEKKVENSNFSLKKKMARFDCMI